MWRLHRYYLKELAVNAAITFIVLFGVVLISLVYRGIQRSQGGELLAHRLDARLIGHHLDKRSPFCDGLDGHTGLTSLGDPLGQRQKGPHQLASGGGRLDGAGSLLAAPQQHQAREAFSEASPRSPKS